jgi:hypothetical protein
VTCAAGWPSFNFAAAGNAFCVAALLAALIVAFFLSSFTNEVSGFPDTASATLLFTDIFLAEELLANEFLTRELLATELLAIELLATELLAIELLAAEFLAELLLLVAGLAATVLADPFFPGANFAGTAVFTDARAGELTTADRFASAALTLAALAFCNFSFAARSASAAAFAFSWRNFAMLAFTTGFPVVDR